MRDTVTLERIHKYTRFLEDIKDRCEHKSTRTNMTKVCVDHKVSRSVISLLREKGALRRKGGGRASSWSWNDSHKITKRFVRTLLEDMAMNNHVRYTNALNEEAHQEVMPQKIAVGTTAKVLTEEPSLAIGESTGATKVFYERKKRIPNGVAKERINRFHMSIGWGLIKVETNQK